MRLIIILLLFFSTSFALYSQNRKNVDSIKIIIQNSKNDSIIARNYVNLGNLYRKATKPDSAMIYAQKSLPYAMRSNDPETIAHTYTFMGAVEYYRWNMGDAISHYQKVDSILTKHNIINKNLYVSYADRAELFRRSIEEENEKDLYIKSKYYYNKALETARSLNDSGKIGKTIMRLGSAESNLGNFNEAKKHFKTVEDYYFNYVYLGTFYADYASLHLKMKDTINSVKYYKLSFDIKNNSKYSFERAVGQKQYAYALFLSKKYKESINLAKKSADYFSKLNPPDYGRLSGLYTSLSKTHQVIRDYKGAYNYMVLSEEIDDSIASVNRKKEGLELETKYQTEKKEQEIALLKSQNELTEQQNRNQRNLMLGGLGLTSVVGVFLFLGYRNRKKTNDKLRELDQVKSNFFANISHEFRTPLSLISGPIEQQLQKENITTQERQNLNIAQRNSTRLVTLVDQLLDLSKLESGHFALKVQEGNLATFLKSLTSSFEFMAQENNQTYTSQTSINDHTYWFDTDALEKIITNLISNALKYSPNKETISIISTIKNQELLFEIKNSGSQLSPQSISTLFDRFQRADETTAGSGIGLALTKELVELHKGSIFVKSDTQWTTFTVTIPVEKTNFLDSERIDGSVTHKAFAKATPTKNSTLQESFIEEIDIFSKDDKPILLIVDDNEDLRTYVSSLFIDTHIIHTAINGKEGLEKALEHVPDLIITDLMMPEDDGIVLTRNCKTSEATSHIPIIMLTAKAGDENKLIGLETGADAYITKPFKTEILKATVQNLQETRDKLQKRFSQELVLLPRDIATNSVDEQFLTNLQKVIDKNLTEPDFNTEAFAQAVGMSRMQLHRKLKALAGVSATEFIRKQRLKLAAQMLKKPGVSISEVGYTVGFNNHSYFTKCFKEQYGTSPSDYSKKS